MNRSATPEYRCWLAMIHRCNNPKNPAFKNYGGRGIKVCARWCIFENFFADMGQRPSTFYSLDRINNDGDYEANNCRWVTRNIQMGNTRRTKFYPYSTVGTKIAVWLEESRMSRGEFAKKIMISDSMLSLILRGKRNLTRDMMLAIYRVTKGKITPNDLCGVRK